MWVYLKESFLTATDKMSKIMTNYLFQKCVEIHHKYYIVSYPYGMKWYKIILPRVRNPCMIDKVETIVGSEIIDVTNVIFDYMGPCYNFHGQKITPQILGYSNLRFTFLDDTIETFQEQAEIIFQL